MFESLKNGTVGSWSLDSGRDSEVPLEVRTFVMSITKSLTALRSISDDGSNRLLTTQGLKADHVQQEPCLPYPASCTVLLQS